MMRLLVILALLLSTAAAHAAAPEQTRQKLRSLAMLPSVSVTVNMNTRELYNPDAALSTNELTRRIVELQKQLEKNPTDAERQLQLGGYLSAVDRDYEASNAFARAVQILRPRAENSPRDGALQAQFATALSDLDDEKQAERVLRAGISAAPEDWNCWVGLGEMLDHREMMDLCGETNRPVGDAPLDKQVAAMLLRKPTPGALREAQACQDEADKCFDHAVALAPKEPDTYIARITHRIQSGFVRQMIDAATAGRETNLGDSLAVMSSPDISFDLARVVHLSPTNQAAIGCWGWTTLLPVLPHGEGKPIDRLSEEQRKNVLEAMRLLEGLTDSPNPRAAAGALEDLGILRLMATGERELAKSAFQRAVALDPSRDQAWEGLVGMSVDGDPHELVSVCERRVKVSNTIRNQLALARACDHANLSEAALEHARAAVKLDSKDPYALVCLGALLLRRSADPNAEAEMKEALDAALEAFKDRPVTDDLEHLGVTISIDGAIRLALEGHVDAARESLHAAAALAAADDKDKDRIKEVETVIGN